LHGAGHPRTVWQSAVLRRLLDETGEVTNGQYHLVGLPMSVFVDRQGIIQRIHVGAMNAALIRQYVNEVLQ
jgi:hypothetical protein